MVSYLSEKSSVKNSSDKRIRFDLTNETKCVILKIEREGRTMSEKRFSYNPFNKDYIEGGTSHSVALANKGKTKEFDQYIRGIILDNVLYLRLFYPFNDIEELDLIELKQKSRELLENFTDDLVSQLRGTRIKEIRYNVENDLLEGIGLANI